MDRRCATLGGGRDVKSVRSWVIDDVNSCLWGESRTQEGGCKSRPYVVLGSFLSQ